MTDDLEDIRAERNAIEHLLTDLPKRPPLGVPVGQSNGLATQIEDQTRSSAASASSRTRFRSLVDAMVFDLTHRDRELLALNRQRKEQLVEHLVCLTQSFSGLSPTHHTDLKSWIEGIRTPEQDKAFKCYYEELAIIFLSQALLLKSWSIKEMRRFERTDLNKRNSSLCEYLKAWVPIGRQGWLITQQSLFSWYCPPLQLQEQIFREIEALDIQWASPQALLELISSARVHRPYSPEESGYHPTFYDALWKSFPVPTRERDVRLAFSPTLRDGRMVRQSPNEIQWVGLERSPYLLLLSEIISLWKEPLSPPLWDYGTGIECFSRDQLDFGFQARTTTLARITDLNIFDHCIIQEEKTLRIQGRNTEAQLLRTKIAQYRDLERVRSPGTSLGAIQTLVGLNKVRPGGVLWWFREEPLSKKEGEPILKHLLEKGSLIAEWDLSKITSPNAATPAFPNFIYLFRREAQIEIAHRTHPILIRAQGTLAASEYHLFFDDLFSSLKHPVPDRGSWKIDTRTSPNSQAEWHESWPDPSSSDLINRMVRLQENSRPLGQFVSVRPAQKQKNEPNSLLLEALLLTQPISSSDNGKTIYLWVESNLDQQSLRTTDQCPEHLTGVLAVSALDDRWSDILEFYLSLPIVRDWLSTHAETRNGKWQLKEQTVKLIPIPEQLAKALDLLIRPGPADGDASTLTLLKLISDFPILRSRVAKLEKIVSEEGDVNWLGLMGLLGPSQKTPFTVHPGIQITGMMPDHLPIFGYKAIEIPDHGVYLHTEMGHHVTVLVQNKLFREIFLNQLKQLNHPSWSELTQKICLPRDPQIALATSHELINSLIHEKKRMSEMIHSLNDCLEV